MSVKKDKKKKKKIVPYSKGELIFNVASLIIAIGIGLYFGGRSFYYYGKQNKKLANDLVSLNGSIITNNKVATEGDGLHQDQDGYYFKGNVLNNYVSFANRLFRVIRVNKDGSVKVISDDIVSEFQWGEDSSYTNSNLDNWLDKKEDDNTGIYYYTLPKVEDYLVKTQFTIEEFDGKKVVDGKDSFSNYVTTLSIKDYSNANGKNSYLNINKYFWLIGTDSSNSNLYVSEDGSLLEGNLYETYGVRPVITFKKDTGITGGSGTKEDPYKVDFDKKANLTDSYVKLDNLVWKVYYDKDNVLKFVYNNSIGDDYYSYYSSEFSDAKRKHIAYRLNNEIYNSFAFKDRLLDLDIYTGEVSSDTSFDYKNIYSDKTTVKVGLLNLYDYHNTNLDHYFLSNTTSSVGTMEYVYHNYGLLEEVDITDQAGIVPIISLSKDEIDTSKGDGSFKNPYVLR